MTLFFDTETTGKAFFNLPPSHADQPHLVQLAALLCDGERELGSMNVIIKPDGFAIPADAAAVHGITTERALMEGVALQQALPLFLGLVSAADLLVAHNIEFDALVMEACCHRLGMALPFRRTYCTMHATTDICMLPGRYGYKWPKLSEAYRHFFNEDLRNAHDALADVRACARIYREIGRAQSSSREGL